jgi:peroxisomal membrane protein 2
MHNAAVASDDNKENKIDYGIMMIDEAFPDEETGLLKKATPKEPVEKNLNRTVPQVPAAQPLCLEKDANPNNIQVGPSSRLAAFLVYVWISYSSVLQKRPLMVKCITASIILGFGDLAGQATENWNAVIVHPIDCLRVFRFAFFGLVCQAPFCHSYYCMLDAALPPTPSPVSFSNALKVLIDQLIQAPIFLFLVFCFLGTLEGKSTTVIKEQMDEEYLRTLITNCKLFGTEIVIAPQVQAHTVSPSNSKGKLWTPATIVNMAFVPPRLRVLYTNVFFFFWSICLSLILNRP